MAENIHILHFVENMIIYDTDNSQEKEATHRDSVSIKYDNDPAVSYLWNLSYSIKT